MMSLKCFQREFYAMLPCDGQKKELEKTDPKDITQLPH